MEALVGTNWNGTAGRYHQAVNASERFGCSRYVDPSPGLTGPAGRYHQAATLVAVPDGRNAGTTTVALWYTELPGTGTTLPTQLTELWSQVHVYSKSINKN